MPKSFKMRMDEYLKIMPDCCGVCEHYSEEDFQQCMVGQWEEDYVSWHGICDEFVRKTNPYD